MKNVKSQIIKFTAIAISVLYIFTPLHKEVKYVLHSISHALEMPTNLIFHHHNENLNYKNKSSTTRYHEHNILDLLDGLSEANNSTKNTNIPNIIDIKIDKHFYYSKFNIKKLIATKSPTVIDSYKEKVMELFYIKIKIPPQKYS
ncbi:hypothetical protein [Hwangdonia lutea]|uniref:Uncharacterized protein n=1 Tax=Hwangdonia lutea TaxID=3075823 RepID=A0AA97ENH1_9FLAO|nr:hypothetical protein [Hwangdonia sp. SCSIO 19198]WOD43238.1 hypothetical protein RNZ46_14700 [Hwangdonia sp. SCSIO 19198]